MPTTKALRARPAATLAAMLALGAACFAGCGSSSAPGTTVDPATVVPAGAPVYMGANVRPSGSEKSNAEAAGRALTHQPQPYTRLLAILRTPGSPPLDYGRDVAPWLGPHAGIFFTSAEGVGTLLPLAEAAVLGSAPAGATFPFATPAAQGAIVLDTSDSAKAQAFLESQATHAGAARTSYAGVSYELTPSGIAFGMVDRFAVIGSDSGMHAVIETAHGGAALRAAPGYSRLIAAAPAGALAHLYVNPHQASAKSGAGSSNALVALTGSRESNISLVAGATSLSVYVDASTAAGTSTPGGLLASAAEGASAFDTLPGDSWLALGLGNLGQTLGGNVTGLRELTQLATGLTGTASTSTLSLGGLLQGLLTPLTVLAGNSAQAKADFASWMGSGGVFASGTGLLELKAAAVIESHNPVASREAVGKLGADLQKAGHTVSHVQIPGTEAAISVAVKGLPLSLDVAAGRDANGTARFVLGLGDASVTEALNPPSTLFSSATRSAAASALGEGINPSLVFAVPTLVALLEGIGLTEEPALAKVVPYLRSITTTSGGGHQLGGEVERYKLVVGLRPAGG